MQLRSRIMVAAAALAVIVPLVMIQGSESASASTPIRCGTQFGVWPCLQAVSNSTKIIGVNYWAHNPQPLPEPTMTLDGGAFHLELVGPGGAFSRTHPSSPSQREPIRGPSPGQRQRMDVVGGAFTAPTSGSTPPSPSAAVTVMSLWLIDASTISRKCPEPFTRSPSAGATCSNPSEQLPWPACYAPSR
jgi:hypothetical protein